MSPTSKKSAKRSAKSPQAMAPTATVTAKRKAPARGARGRPKALDKAAAVLKKHGAELRREGVVRLRTGYLFTDGWITGTPAIVVSVLPERLGELRGTLPSTLGGVPVDVTPATPLEQMLLGPGPRAKAVPALHALPEAATLELTLALPGADSLPQPLTASAELVRKSKYEPPPGLALDVVEDAMTLVCHTSPDAGWTTLKPFLEGVKERLTVGMYDFTAPHILKTVKEIMAKKPHEMHLILDPKIALGEEGDPSNPKAKDKDEDEVRKQLAKRLGKRLEFEWAAVKVTGKTTGGIFPTAYHIKVAVADGKRFWASSGNWQSSNQGDIDPLAGHEGGDVYRRYNREWHIVLEHEGLARLLEDYLRFDLSQARAFQVGARQESMPALLMPETVAMEAEAEQHFVGPKRLRFPSAKPLRVQPLLTPDNYAKNVRALLRSAKQRVYFQNQYIKVAKDNAKEFEELLDLLLQKIADGLDVRIILRDLPNTRPMLEALQNYGFDMSHVRTQVNCHNKGIIVDSKAVLVGSHNWSNDGVLYNRDASFIFFHPAVARFYEDVFLFDWEHLALPRVRHETVMPRVEGLTAAGQGLRRMSWWDVYED